MKLRIICLAIAFFGIINGYSQNNQIKNIIPTSPIASALNKYVEFPVSTYTGTPDISVPIYTIKEKGIEVPITLSYNASGIRVAEESSWVGLGWSLIVGGVISRSINDKDDLLSGGGKYGYLKNDLFPTQTNFVEKFIELIQDRDMRPDLFTFNFLGYSGKFYLRNNITPDINIYQVDILNQCPIIITYIKSTETFMVIDDKGYKYKFGIKEICHSQSGTSVGIEPDDAALIPSNPYISSWFLESISDPNDIILVQFNYVTYSDVNYQTKSLPQYAVWNFYPVGQQHSECNLKPYFNSAFAGSGTTLSQDRYYSKSYTFTEPVYLDNIQFSKGKIILGRGDRQDIQSNQYSLTSLSIFNLNNLVTPELTINLHQSYFNDNSSSILEYKRLKLNSVEFIGIDGLKYSYEFDYNTTDLPSKLSNSFDNWGYYNYKNLSGSYTKGPYNMLPQITINSVPGPLKWDFTCGNNYGWDNSCANNCEGVDECMSCWNPDITLPIVVTGADRSPDATYMKAGILEKITYPTGGYVKYKYGIHQFGNNSSFTQGGGLRIEKIYANTGNGEKLFKSYNYEGGKIMTPIFYYNFITNLGYDGGNVWFADLYIKRQGNTFMSLATTGGSYVGYDKVEEIYNDLGKSGKIEYKFKNKADVLPEYLYSNGSSLSHLDNGLLTEKNYYKLLSTSNYERVKSETYSFSSTPQNEISIKEYYIESYDNLSAYYFLQTRYSQWWPLMSKSESLYQNGTPYATISERYSYDNFVHQQPTEIVRTNSDGRISKTKIKYSADLNNDETSASIIGLKSKNIITPIFTTELLETALGSDYFNVVNANYNDYANFGGSLLPASTYSFKSSVPILEDAFSFGTPSTVYRDLGSVVLNTSTASGVYSGVGSKTITLASGEVAEMDVDVTFRHDDDCEYCLDCDYEGSNCPSSCQECHQGGTACYECIPSYAYALWQTSTGKSKAYSTTNSSVFNYDFSDIINVNSNFTVDFSLTLVRSISQISRSASLRAEFYGLTNAYTINSNLLKPDIFYDSYNSKGLLTQFHTPDNISTSILYGYSNVLPIAKIVNSTTSLVSYTSFERSDDKGGFTYSGSSINSIASKTGQYYYPLSSGGITRNIPLGKHILTFYTTGNIVLTQVLGTIGFTLLSTSDADANGWKLYQYSLNCTSQGVFAITGSVNLDEIRFYPVNAQMTTYTYNPLIGLTSVTDENSRVTTFKYDGLGRLIETKDNEGKILEHYEYNYVH